MPRTAAVRFCTKQVHTASSQSPSSSSGRIREIPRGRRREELGFGREGEAGEDDRGGAQRPAGEEGACQVQRGRHHRRPQEARGGADGHQAREDPHPEVVHHLQGPHHPRRLRDPRRHGPRALLQLEKLVWSAFQSHYLKPVCGLQRAI